MFDNFPETVSQPSGQVFNVSASDFVISDGLVSGAAEFIFVTLDGGISAWREGMSEAVQVRDNSAEGAMYFGIAVTSFPENNRIFVADFNLERIEAFDHNWNPIDLTGKFVDPSVPLIAEAFNILCHEDSIYVAWAHIGDEPGEEDSFPGYGYISRFDLDGNLLGTFEHTLELNAPWGLVVAPPNFGAFSDALLVANFGTGRILGYNRDTYQLIDLMRDANGDPLEIDGVWDMKFGNGDSLGVANHLYFTAGPNGEEDGIFGKLVAAPTCLGDLNLDNLIDQSDLNLVLADLGCIDGWGVCPGDADGDRDVDQSDLNLVLAGFGAGCN